MIIETDIYKDKHIDYIFHLADIHITNDNLRHPEYRSVFKLLYSKLKKHKKKDVKKQYWGCRYRCKTVPKVIFIHLQKPMNMQPGIVLK